MTKKTITISALLLITAILTACSSPEYKLPAPYDALYTIQSETTNKLANAGQKLGTMIASPEKITIEASTLETYLQEQKTKITNLTFPDAENIKQQTLKELENASMLIASIKANADKLSTEPVNSEDIKTLLNGYLSRLDSESTKFTILSEKLVKQIDPEAAANIEPTKLQPPNPRATEATI